MIQYLFKVVIDDKGKLYFTGDPTEENVHPREAQLMKMITDAINGAVLEFTRTQQSGTIIQDVTPELKRLLEKRQQAAIDQQQKEQRRRNRNA